jgi:subtilase family serine protease
LPACTTANGCFRKVDQRGGTSYPATNTGWASEISLDVDMVSAICPNCHILLVEADNNQNANLALAVDEAVALGANAVSNSYGGSEASSELSIAPHYNHPGVAITASSGDSGYGTEQPAAFNSVISVGGTTLKRNSTVTRGWTETAWTCTTHLKCTTLGGPGSGCSKFVSKQPWQTDACSNRTIADVSAVANPNTGVAVYDTFGNPGWSVFGGTSVASPIIASIYALAGNEASITPGAFLYSNTSSLYDVTSGRNGSCGTYLCTAGPGYDGPTGNGTPNGIAAF